MFMESYDMHVVECLASFSQHYIYEFYPSPLLPHLLSCLLEGNKVPIQRENIWVDDLIGIFKKENMLFRLIQDLVRLFCLITVLTLKNPKCGKKFWISGLGFEEGIKERVMMDEKLLASSLGQRLKAGLLLDALSVQSPFISLCSLFPGNFTYHNSGSFLLVMKAHSEYKMFSRKLISTACTRFVRCPQVTPASIPRHTVLWPDWHVCVKSVCWPELIFICNFTFQQESSSA